LTANSPQPQRFTGETVRHLWSLRQGREQFQQVLFDTFKAQRFELGLYDLSQTEAVQTLELLGQWIAEAPLGTPAAEYRIMALRSTLRSLAFSLGIPPARVLAEMAGLSPMAAEKDPRVRRKMALLADVMMAAPEDLDRWAAREPGLATIFALRALNDQGVEGDRLAGLNGLARWLASREPVGMPPQYFQFVQSASFHASYLTSVERHGARAFMVRQGMAMLPPINQERPLTPTERPRLVVAGEMLRPGHAMYRCFAEPIRDMRRHFTVILWADNESESPEHREIADEVHYYPFGVTDYPAVFRQVQSLAPDILLFPSIAFTPPIYALSLLRLAPLQVALSGHPVASHSPMIDATAVFENLHWAEDEGFGKIITFPNQPLQVPRTGVYPTQITSEAEGPPMLGILGSPFKLNAEFLDAVAAILDRAPPGCGVQFFPDRRGLEFAAISARLRARFPGALVHPSTDYRTYVDHLSRSSVVLQTFPFGGTNTTIDALALGLPVVCLGRPELAAAADEAILAMDGVPDLCCPTVAAYLDLAVRLLGDGGLRAQFRQRMRPIDLEITGMPQGADTIAVSLLHLLEERLIPASP